MFGSVTIKEVKLALGLLCKQKRQQLGQTQEGLAEALGLSRLTIQHFESGKNATLDTVLKIANHFELLEMLYEAIQTLQEKDNMNSMY